MEHREVKRIVKQADKALLFIHGIAGTPNHFKPFEEFIPHDITFYNLLLDGHGKTVRDFSKTSMKKWEEQVEKAVGELSENHNEIYIVAHSMGTLFSIEQAIKNEKIVNMFLLAVPVKLFLKPAMISNSLKVYLGKISPDDKVALAAKNCYGIDSDKNPLNYIGWIPRYLELFSKIRETRKNLNSLNTPCRVYQSCNDEMVSQKVGRYLKDNSNISVFELKSSRHYYYADEDLKYLTEEFKKFIN